MDDLLKKFMKDEFNISDYEALKDEVANMTDEELSSKLDNSMSTDDFSLQEINDIQRRLNHDIRKSKRMSIFRYMTYIASTILIVLLIGSGYYIFKLRQSTQMYEEILSHEVFIGTEQGEKINTVLPDGSKVVMSPMSSLTYKVSTFNHVLRNVSFCGEAQFSVTKNEKAPFIVRAQDFEIKVLGTIFSILSRDNIDIIEIHLDEGSIELTAIKQNTHKILKEGETAVLNRESGELKIYTESDGYRYAAGKSVIFFTSEKLGEVLNILTKYYGKKFKLNGNLFQKVFTGSLPTDNLTQALYILEQTLNLKITNHGDNYVIISN